MSSESANHEYERRRRVYEATVLSHVWEHRDSLGLEQPGRKGIEIVRVSLSGDPPETQLTVEWTRYGEPKARRHSFPVWPENESMDWAAPTAADIFLAIEEGIARGVD
jgi:hypothetical protein